MIVGSRRRLGQACAAAIAAWIVQAAPGAAQPGPAPPDASGICPGIDEDGLLCSADPLSGNCADFVAAADRLGALYRSELAQLPGSEGSLLTTTWWGCGPGILADVTALLAQIGSPHAVAVLRTQPYATLAAQRPPPPPPSGAAPSAPALPPDCNALSDPLQRNNCIGAQLQAARAENRSVLARCQPLVPEGMRDDFADSQATFQSLLPARCNAQAAEFPEKRDQTFIRSRCLVQALDDNTRGILTAHPECQASN
jgi:hypothetical protein